MSRTPGLTHTKDNVEAFLVRTIKESQAYVDRDDVSDWTRETFKDKVIKDTARIKYFRETGEMPE
jgi:hypothetical protein